MKLAVGADHAGFTLKAVLCEHLVGLGHEVLDLGTGDATSSVDYPTFGAAVAHAVASGDAELGVCVCGTGIGIAMAAGSVPGIRAATVHDVTSARLAREHNHANVLCLGARLSGEAVALDALDAFLAAVPLEGRHERRVAQLEALRPDRTSP
jgi:ribose 5-phosphate isomerase B